jgi:hypothetical protein
VLHNQFSTFVKCLHLDSKGFRNEFIFLFIVTVALKYMSRFLCFFVAFSSLFLNDNNLSVSGRSIVSVLLLLAFVVLVPFRGFFLDTRALAGGAQRLRSFLVIVLFGGAVDGTGDSTSSFARLAH